MGKFLGEHEERGLEKERKRIAKSMIVADYSMGTIQDITGLSEEEIKLAKALDFEYANIQEIKTMMDVIDLAVQMGEKQAREKAAEEMAKKGFTMDQIMELCLLNEYDVIKAAHRAGVKYLPMNVEMLNGFFESANRDYREI